MPANCQASAAVHKGKKILIIQFKFDKEAVQRFKKLPGAKWSTTLRSWYLPDTAAYRRQFNVAEKSPIGKAVLQQIHEANKSALAKMEELLILKNSSSSTRKTYLTEFAQLLYILGKMPVIEMDYERLKKYLAWCITVKKISANQLHSRINAIKFYYEQVVGREDFFAEIPRPKSQCFCQKY